MAPLAARVALWGGVFLLLCVGTYFAPEPGVGWARVFLLAPLVAVLIARPISVTADAEGLVIGAPLRRRTITSAEVERIEIRRRGFPIKSRQLLVVRTAGDPAAVAVWGWLHGWGMRERARQLHRDLEAWLAYAHRSTASP